MQRNGETISVALLLLGLVGVRADEQTDKVAQQKKTAEANWAQVEAGELATHETSRLLLLAPKALEKRLKEHGTQLEKHYTLAKKALELDPNKEPWEGKLTVYLLGERDHYTAFVRRVEQRRLDSDEAGSFSAHGDTPHVAASPPRGKLDPSLELQAAEQIAGALLSRRAGTKVEVPGWVVSGFGRATLWRSSPASFAKERALAAAVVGRNRLAAKDVWGDSLSPDDATVVRASLIDYLAYGPGSAKFPLFVESFKANENGNNPALSQVFQAANINADKLDVAWRRWLPGR